MKNSETLEYRKGSKALLKPAKLKSKRLSSLSYVSSEGQREWARKQYRRRLYEQWEKHFFDTMPKEVYEAWFANMAPLISTEAVRKEQLAIEMWPAWYPWEVLKNSIPEEVHEAYNREAHPGMFKTFDEVWAESHKNGQPSGGIMEAIANAPVHTYDPGSFTKTDFDNLVQRFEEEQDRHFEEMDREKEQLKADKIIWDKYYKPYGLKFRS